MTIWDGTTNSSATTIEIIIGSLFLSYSLAMFVDAPGSEGKSSDEDCAAGTTNDTTNDFLIS